MTFADKLSDSIRSKARNNAIWSALFGCVSEQAIDTNTLLILYLIMLGGSDSFSMFSTAIAGVAFTVLSIPAAGLVNRLGLRCSYSAAIYAQTAMFLLIAAAPWTGKFAVMVVLAAFTFFCILRAFYAATWYPVVDSFLRNNERGSFFGRMRFSYMIFNMFLIFAVGQLMGQNPPVWLMQLYFAVAGLGLLGRKYFLDKLPLNVDCQNSKLEILPALKISMSNTPLVGFSFYFGFLNLAALSAFPLAVIYMKSFLNYGASTIMVITAIGIAGQIIGFSLVGRLLKKLTMRYFQVLTHLLFALAIGGLLFTNINWFWSCYLLGTLFFMQGVALAFLLCIGSTEMLALARPGNKVMAISFASTFQYLGNALGRLGSTMLIAMGVLAERWTFGSWDFSHFHTLFLFDFVLTFFGLTLLLLTPAVVSERSDYYAP